MDGCCRAQAARKPSHCNPEHTRPHLEVHVDPTGRHARCTPQAYAVDHHVHSPAAYLGLTTTRRAHGRTCKRRQAPSRGTKVLAPRK
ncbi:hypothetical protein NDU88_004819 [Pleurodeles waltl]|uniref:Uncharacterized protein n=1 Tax=Pleurodeles waltl TaxID=8319 RepID=A0AAV7TT27_PLEWA|nr:hypothetical protein NDU88_004819 [Pleurodeles waltl]